MEKEFCVRKRSKDRTKGVMMMNIPISQVEKRSQQGLLTQLTSHR